MNSPTNLPAERTAMPPIVKLGNQLDQRADEFRKALPSHIPPEKLQRTIITAAQNNPDLLAADRQSLITSCMKAAQDGLLPDGREAALVIFSTKVNNQWVKQVQYMPMVYGLRKKIVQSGEVSSLQTGLVYRAEMEAGAFIYEVGMEPPIRHRPMLDLPAEELTDDKIVAAYSMAKLKDGTVSVEVMRRGEIDKVRQMSQTGALGKTWKDGKPKEPKGPWVDWFGEMARKTVMRRHSKTLPMSGDVIIDIEGQEHEASVSASRLLDATEPDAPISLPGRDEYDEQTGEVIEQEPAKDSRGMTEVDEETARALDAGETDQDQTQAEAAAETVNAIDGPLEQGDPGPQPESEQQQSDQSSDDAPLWRAQCTAIFNRLKDATAIKDVNSAEKDWVNKVLNGVPGDETDGANAIASIEKAIREAKQRVKEG